MLAEELIVMNADAPFWKPIQPLLKIALRLEQEGDAYSWHGWKKSALDAFLASLPTHCTVVAAVWETQEDEAEREELVLNCICEVMEGEVRSVCTLEALAPADLPPIRELEPGYEHALEIMRVVRAQIAPVAWAIFTDRATWDEWLYEEGEDVEKGELLAQFARHGRCVLLGSQVRHHHP